MIIDPDPNSYMQGQMSLRPSWQLPVGSMAWQGKTDAEAAEARQRAESGGDGGGGVVLLALVAPPLIPPGYVLYHSWQAMTAAQWHPLYRGVAVGLELYGLIGALCLAARFMPRVLAGLVGAGYCALCYGASLASLGATQNWIIGCAVVTGIIGFFLGRALHEAAAASRVSLASLGRGLVAIGNGICVLCASAVWLAAGCVALRFGYDWLHALSWQGWQPWALIGAGVAYVLAVICVPFVLARQLAGVLPRGVMAALLMVLLGAGALAMVPVFTGDVVWIYAAVGGAALGGIGLAGALREG